MLAARPVTSDAEAIVGREHELGRLQRALDALPEGSFLDLTGEAGIGKTCLFDELRRRADERDMLVLEGRAAEYEVDLPFGILVDALDEYLAELDPARFDRVAGEAAADLAAVFPSLERRATGAGRFGPHRAVAGLLERLPPGRGLLLVLDDLHWADEASVEVLAHVVRRPPPRGLVVAFGRRPGQGRGRLAAALEAAERRRIVERIELGALAEADAVALLPRGTDPARAHRLCVMSGGNPFYLEQLARGGGGEPSATPGPVPDDVTVPGAVIAALSVELDALPAAARTLLEAGALVGEPFELDLAIVVAEQAGVAALDALDVLLARDLVRPTDVPRRLRFRHPILRRAVYESSPLGWRLAAHARAAAALEARRAPATALARHVEQAATRGDEHAVEVLAAAGAAAAPRAPAAAAHWFAAALRLLPEGAEPARRVRLLAPWAFNRAVTGRLEESRQAMVEAIAALPPDELEVRTRITSFCAAIEHFLGRHEQAHDRLVAAVPWIPDDPSPAAAAIAVELAGDAFLQGSGELLRTWAARGVELAAASGEPLLEAAATAQLAFAALHEGRPAEAQRLRAAACVLMDRVPADRIVERLEVSYYVGMMEHLLESDEDAARHLEHTLEGAEETGKTFVLAPAGAVLAQARLRRGQVAEAAEAAADAVDAARLTANPQSVTQALAAHSRALLAAGDLREAVAAAQESVRLTAALEPSALAAVPALALGAALLELGRPDEAAAAVLGTARLPLVTGTTGCEAHELLVRAALAAGRRDEAERLAARAEARAERVELPVTRAQAGRARALVSLDAGDARGAARAALAAAASAGSVGAVLEEARARLLAGVAKAAGGERASAVAELTAAHETFAACGARRLVDATAQELRRLGERVPRRTLKPDGGQGFAGLTAREREIAQLVDDGRMNREIAAELFLSEKTVETHLRNIFAKLGVASRTDVAATVRREARG